MPHIGTRPEYYEGTIESGRYVGAVQSVVVRVTALIGLCIDSILGGIPDS